MKMSYLTWLIGAPVAVLMYFLNRNEAKFKKNLAVGVTFPQKGREDPAVLRLLAGYKREQLCICLGMVALAVLAALLAGDGLNMLVFVLWVDLLIVVQFISYARYNTRLKQVKRERGWTVPVIRTASVTAAAVPAKRPGVWWFVAAAGAAAIPAAFDRDLWYMYLLDAAMALACWAGSRYLYRNRAETVDENDAVTQALTRVRRRAWDRVWLLCAWMMAVINIGIWLSASLFPDGQVLFWVVIALSLGVCAAAVALEFRVRRVQEKLTAQSGEGFYVDEDDKWIWGQFYYDPNDSQIMINARTGVNTTVNLARPGGKVVLALTLALLFVGMPVMGVLVDAMCAPPLPLAVGDGALVAASWGKDYVLSLEDMEDVELIDELPGMTRVMGVGSDTLLKGRFSTDWGDAKLCLDPRTGPWLKVTMDDGTLYLVGGGDAAAIYEQIAK